MTVDGRSRLTSGLSIAAAIAGAHFLLHALTNGNYGVFRDELYYLDCARHLGWGYVDQPPLSIWLLAGARALLGESVHAIRLLSELAGATLVMLAALIAREMGGGRSAQVIAALGTALASGLLVVSGFYSMNAFDLVFWALLAWIVARIAARDDPRYWLWFGLMAGLGLLNKISVLFLGFGITVALVLTPLRRHFRHWQLYAGGAIAAVIFAPYVLWNWVHDWPTLEFMANAKQYKIAAISPVAFLAEQVLAMGPAAAPLWIGGLLWLLVAEWRGGGKHAVLGWTYLVVFALLVSLKVKPYYLSAGYAMLFAAGGCAVESLLALLGGPRVRAWATGLAMLWIVGTGALTIPLAVPLLSADGFLRYQEALGLAPKHYENNPVGAMPQYFSDRFGWQNMAAVVASVYEALPAADREACLILGSNYGEAGAINYYGPALGLPPARSTHNSHYLWGPGIEQPRVVLHIGGSRERFEELFDEVEVAAIVQTTYGMPFENDLPVFVLRGLKMPLDEAWRAGKYYI